MTPIQKCCDFLGSQYSATSKSKQIKKVSQPASQPIDAQRFLTRRDSDEILPHTLPEKSLAPVYMLHSNNVHINTPEDLASFKSKWVRKVWDDRQAPLRVRVFDAALYKDLHIFLGSDGRKPMQSGKSGRVLKIGKEGHHVMKRSSPRKLTSKSKEQEELVMVNEHEFSFYEDIQNKMAEIGKTCKGKPNFPKVKLLLSLDVPVSFEEPGPSSQIKGSKSYAILMENFGLDLFEVSNSNRSQGLEEQFLHILNILEALVFIHKAGYVHLDCKLENFTPRGILDFGFTQKVDSSGSIKTRFGTAQYLSPEISFLGACNQKTDVWSLGVAAYIAFTDEYLLDLESNFSAHPGSIINRLALMYTRLGKVPDDMINRFSQELQDELFKKDSTTGRMYLKRGFRYANTSHNPKTSNDPFTIKPFTPECEKHLFPRFLESFNLFRKKDKWVYLEERKGSIVEMPLSEQNYNALLEEWRQRQTNSFIHFEKRIEEVALDKCKEMPREEQERQMYYARLLADFLSKALEPDLTKRATSEELLDTELIKVAKRIQESRLGPGPVSSSIRKASGKKVAKKLFA